MPDQTRIRPIDWRDIPLLHRLRDRGLCLDSQRAYTRGANPLQAAFLDAITPTRGDCTLVAPHDSKRALTAIGQVSHRHHQPIARLTFLAPALAIGQANSLRLLEALAVAVGRRGGHHLIAEVDEQDAAFESLRRANFAVYARQRVWQLDDQPPAGEEEVWRPEGPRDQLAVNRLYLNVVPGLVQQVEPPPAGPPLGWVHWDDPDLHGYLDIHVGPRGVWIHPYLHPAAREHETLLAAAFAQLAAEQDAPLFVCVRSYQGWMNAALERMALKRRADQAVMVKRLAAPVRQTSESPLPNLEATRPEPTAPFAPSTEMNPFIGAEHKTR